MAKEYYDVTYKTYHNERIKPVLFQGESMYPLYVQVTYDRKTTFFKSYYFDLYSQPKYYFLNIGLLQVEEMENRVIDKIIERNKYRFNLKKLLLEYKLLSADLLDSFDRPFKSWLSGHFKKEGWFGMAAVMGHELAGVASIQIWDDLKKHLLPDVFERLEEKAVRLGPPYIPLAYYVRSKMPDSPFCLPLHDWLVENRRMAIEEYVENTFERVDFGRLMQTVKDRLYPMGVGWH